MRGKKALMKSLALALLLCLPVAARPLPPIIPPGAVQPLAPGYRAVPTLPTLDWHPRAHQIDRVQYAGNGHIEVAHAVVLVEPNSNDEFLLNLTRQAVRGALDARPSLHQVDVSVYQRVDYMGFGGRPPMMTASVPRERLLEFERGGLSYRRLWSAARARTQVPPRADVTPAEEGSIVFHGNPSQLESHRQNQEQSYGKQDGLFFRGNPEHRRIALTFDDSPHPMYETLLLDTLARAKVRATFFCIGRNARAYPYLITDMVTAGHEVANHTYHHVRLPGLSAEVVRKELQLGQTVLEGLTHRKVRLFRPPGGDYSPETLEIARSLGLITTFWTDDPGDFNNPGEALLQSRLDQHLRPGGIVLLHDNVQETIDVLPSFLQRALEQGFQVGTASQLLNQ